MKLYLVAHVLLLVLSRHRRLWRWRRCCWSHRNKGGLDPGGFLYIGRSVSLSFRHAPCFCGPDYLHNLWLPCLRIRSHGVPTRVSFFPPGVGIRTSRSPLTRSASSLAVC